MVTETNIEAEILKIFSETPRDQKKAYLNKTIFTAKI